MTNLFIKKSYKFVKAHIQGFSNDLNNLVDIF